MRTPPVVITAALSAAMFLCRADAPVETRVITLEKRLDEIQRRYEARIAALEAEVAGLRATVARSPAAPQPGTFPGPGQPPTAAAQAGVPAGQPAPEAAAGGGGGGGGSQAGAGENAPGSPEPTPTAASPPSPGDEPGRIPAPVIAGGESGTPPPSPLPTAPAQTSNYFNPSISVIGNYLGVAGRNHTENLPVSSLRESEMGLQAIVDPYARADFFIAFGEEGVEVEEGVITFTSLPAGWLAKVGRMRMAFGKTNPLHLHVLPWPDEPLPIVNLLGGEEGWVGSGVSAAHLIPMPADIFSEITLQVVGGDADGLFEAPKRSDLAYNGHYRLFKDLSESTNLDLGFSYGLGPNGTTTNADTQLQGIDATLRWKPLRTASYRSASLRGEFIRSRREQPGGTQASTGWFVSGDYQLSKRWFLGARGEASRRADDDSVRDVGQAVILTFWPSEFSQIRAELRRRRYSDVETANEALLQVQFAIGAHGAHPF